MRNLVPASIWVLCAALVRGQADTAALSGRVTDPSGAVIVGADVTVTNTATGSSNQMKANEAGVYNFSVPAHCPFNHSQDKRPELHFRQLSAASVVVPRFFQTALLITPTCFLADLADPSTSPRLASLG